MIEVVHDPHRGSVVKVSMIATMTCQLLQCTATLVPFWGKGGGAEQETSGNKTIATETYVIINCIHTTCVHVPYNIPVMRKINGRVQLK